MYSQSPEDFDLSLRPLGAWLELRNNRLWLKPAAAFQQLSQEQHAYWRAHRKDLKELVRSGRAGQAAPLPAPVAEPLLPPAPTEPEPVVYVGGRRVTDWDVRRHLRAEGDAALAHYVAGRMSKADAYARARCAMRQALEMQQ